MGGRRVGWLVTCFLHPSSGIVWCASSSGGWVLVRGVCFWRGGWLSCLFFFFSPPPPPLYLFISLVVVVFGILVWVCQGVRFVYVCPRNFVFFLYKVSSLSVLLMAVSFCQYHMYCQSVLFMTVCLYHVYVNLYYS